MKCSLARVLWNIPLMIFPPMIMARLSKINAIGKSPGLRIATEMGVIIGMVCLAWLVFRETIPHISALHYSV